jgi:hypothetical protein
MLVVPNSIPLIGVTLMYYFGPSQIQIREVEGRRLIDGAAKTQPHHYEEWLSNNNDRRRTHHPHHISKSTS